MSDPEHVTAARALRQQRIRLIRPTTEPEVQIRALTDYDTALGLGDSGQDDDGGSLHEGPEVAS